MTLKEAITLFSYHQRSNLKSKGGLIFQQWKGFHFLDDGKKGIIFLVGCLCNCEGRNTTMAKKHTNMDPVVDFEMPAGRQKTRG